MMVCCRCAVLCCDMATPRVPCDSLKQDPFALGSAAMAPLGPAGGSGAAGPDEAARDRSLASEVGGQIVRFAFGRLSDYHRNFPAAANMQVRLEKRAAGGMLLPYLIMVHH